VQTGTAVPHISGRQIVDFRFPLPPLPEQERIADVLGALDDKIELNRRTNRTLESMARAIFRSWFVDITPPRGQAGGGESAYPSVEWPEIAFGDTVHILSGGTPRTSEPEYWGGEVPWYSVADAPTDADVFVEQTQKSITDAGLENSAAQLVPALTTIISARGTVGTCAMTARPMAFNQSCFGLRPRDGFGIYYTYFSTLTAVDSLRRSAHGSVFSTITRDTFRSVAVRKPPRHRVEAFEQAAEPFMNRVLLNVRETRRLVAIRDALLPRLMSGALRHDAPAEQPSNADA
jgi:type I restriction enzyme S subunit